MLSEKQNTQRSPMRPVEVSYVSSDATELTGEGYQFNLPIRWTSQQSTNKMIGLRRLSYVPWWGCIGFTICIYNASNELESTYNTELLQFTSTYTLQDCIIKLQEAASWTDEDTETDYKCVINYIDDEVYMHFSDDNGNDYKWRLVFTENVHYDGENLLRLFNQEVTNDSREYIMSTIAAGDYMVFSGVWNRQDLYFHSSFSDSTRQIIGANGDFWEEPSVFYSAMLNSNTFTLRFTQDTVTKIIPRNGTLLVQFCLIFNCLRYLD